MSSKRLEWLWELVLSHPVKFLGGGTIVLASFT